MAIMTVCQSHRKDHWSRRRRKRDHLNIWMISEDIGRWWALWSSQCLVRKPHQQDMSIFPLTTIYCWRRAWKGYQLSGRWGRRWDG